MDLTLSSKYGLISTFNFTFFVTAREGALQILSVLPLIFLIFNLISTSKKCTCNVNSSFSTEYDGFGVLFSDYYIIMHHHIRNKNLIVYYIAFIILFQNRIFDFRKLSQIKQLDNFAWIFVHI